MAPGLLPRATNDPAEPGAAIAAGPGGSPEPPERVSLFRKLVWLTLFRLTMITVLLGATAVVTWQTAAGEADAASPLYALILATYLVSLAFAIVLRWRRWLVPVASAQVALDVGLAAAVVRLTGASESVFLFLFLLAIVNGSILLYRRGAIVSLALAAAAYLVAVVPGGAPPAFRLFVHLSAFAATAALSGYLAELLRRTGERLEEREVDLAAITALHESIVQSVSSGLVTVDAGGRVTFLNRAGEEITGLSTAEVRGEPASRWFAAFQPTTARGETDFVNARGEVRRVGYTVFPLVGRGGGQIGSAVIFQDLTELRGMEAAVQRSERLADLGRLAAGLAHELRNPLASVSGCIELLRANAPLSAEDARLMDIVLREATRLNQLVTRFLEFSRPAPVERRGADLAAIAAETLDVFANDPAAARVRLDRALDSAPVACDTDQVKQVLWNLLANAAQALGGREGGANGGPAGAIRVSCGAAEDGGAWMAVEDDGPGIAAADLSRVFIPFFTTKERGTGLGLATVHRVVEAHGGSIDVDSAPGRGARFTVRLPGPAPAPSLPAG